MFSVLFPSGVIVYIRYVWVRKTSLALRGLCHVALVLRGGCNHGDGGSGRGSGGRAGGKTQQQVALGAVDVQGLGAVFAAAGLLSSPDQGFKGSTSRRGVSLSWTQGYRL